MLQSIELPHKSFFFSFFFPPCKMTLWVEEWSHCCSGSSDSASDSNRRRPQSCSRRRNSDGGFGEPSKCCSELNITEEDIAGTWLRSLTKMFLFSPILLQFLYRCSFLYNDFVPLCL